MKIKLLDPECKPYRKYDTDAGIDLRARESCIIYPGEAVKIPAGICVEIPTGHVGDISPRSSVSLQGLAIQGKVDSGYTGEVGIIAINCVNKAIKITKGDRIAQLVVLPVEIGDMEIVEELPESERGGKGFGSTGEK